MKNVVIFGVVCSILAGCASNSKLYEPQSNTYKESSVVKESTVVTSSGTPPVKYPQIPEFEAHALTRNEVIQGSSQCVDAGMKPFVEYITQKTEYGRVMTPVNVHCIVTNTKVQ